MREVKITNLVQLFVAKVDAQLLKRVGVENLKAVNVQDANHKALVGFLEHERIATDDDPVKQAPVAAMCMRARGVRPRFRFDDQFRKRPAWPPMAHRASRTSTWPASRVSAPPLACRAV